jgi:pimeloyl-ACP methyl ester carboxylesterase
MAIMTRDSKVLQDVDECGHRRQEKRMRVFLTILVAVAATLVGTFVFLRAPDVPRSALETKYATTPSHFLTLSDGARVHYRDQGPRRARVLILVHGSNASLFTWEPWVKRLSDTLRLVTIDMPGHGLTGAVPSHDYSPKGMVDFVDEVADKVGLTKFAIGGNSMGGGIAARFAEDYPARVTALILIDAGGMPGNRLPFALELASTPIVNHLMLNFTPRAMIAHGLNISFVHQNLVTPARINEYWELNRMAGTREATIERLQGRSTHDPYIKNHARAIKVPTLILWGAQDRVLPVGKAYEYAAVIPGAKLIIYHDAGHVVQEDEADQSAADVRAFLEK